MNRTTIYSRTGKGDIAAVTGELVGDLRKVLEAVDGQASVDALQERMDFTSALRLEEALAALVEDGLIREATADTLQTDDSQRKAQELRAKIKARREGGDPRDAEPGDEGASAQGGGSDPDALARRQAEEQARKLAEEQAKREAAERARLDAEAQARRMAEELARRDAEEQARREAEQRARREAEDAARQEQERQRREVEERERAAAEEKARIEAEERARIEADERSWREAEEKLRREEEKAANKARKRAASREAEAASPRRAKTLLLAGVGAGVALVLLLVVAHLISYDGQIASFEKAVGARLQQPVRIKALRLSLLPRVQLRLEDVTVGAEGQIRIPAVRATGSLGNLWRPQKSFTAVEFEAPVVSEAGLGWLLFGPAQGPDVAFGEIRAKGLKIDSAHLVLPPLDVRFSPGAGILAESADKGVAIELTPGEGSVAIAFKARSFKLPFGSELVLDELAASATATPAGLAVSEFKGFLLGGVLSGNARLAWGRDWSLGGELEARQIDVSRLLPGIAGDGRLAGRAVYAMQAADATRLFAGKRVEGGFLVTRGTLLGVDFGRMMVGSGLSGETRFAELGGSFLHDSGATQVRQLRLTEDALSATGAVDVDGAGNLGGRVAVELRMATEQRRGGLALGGTLGKIEWRRF